MLDNQKKEITVNDINPLTKNYSNNYINNSDYVSIYILFQYTFIKIFFV